MKGEHKLTKCERSKKMWSGVCGGIASYFQVDPTWIRVAFVLLALFGDLIGALFAYFILSWIMPDFKKSASTTQLNI